MTECILLEFILIKYVCDVLTLKLIDSINVKCNFYIRSIGAYPLTITRIPAYPHRCSHACTQWTNYMHIPEHTLDIILPDLMTIGRWMTE